MQDYLVCPEQGLRLIKPQFPPPQSFARATKTKGLARRAKPLNLLVLLTGIELVTY
jgi:hypothetical protein